MHVAQDLHPIPFASRSGEPVLSKEARVIGEVRIGKTAETATHTVRDEVRKEDVEVDEGVDIDGPGLRDKR
jgi:stress response protein YsnF